MKHVGVFCGSSSGARPEYTAAAVELGNILVETEPRALLDQMESWAPPAIDKTKWILGLEDA